MVKFGKQYRQLQLDEWKKYYLDYKGLKHKIRQMKRVLVKDIKVKDKSNRPSLLSTPLLPDEIANNEEANKIFKDKKGEHLKEFIDLLIKEFQKSYGFFTGIEKVLIKKVNTHLYTQTSYSTYTLAELSKEMKSLSLTIYLAKCLNGFINDIMMAVKKILKKFDKHFSHLYGLITPHIILKLLSKDKSELEYLLQFKVIDEISIISERCADELKRYFDQNTDVSNSDNLEYRNSFLEKYNETLKYIRDIDELIYFKTQYKDWVDYISKNKVKNTTKYLENDIFNPILSASYYKDNLLDKFLSTRDAFNEIKTIQRKITLVNKRNIILILTQTFFFNSLLTCIFPVLYYYIYIMGFSILKSNFYLMNILIFLVVGAAYLGEWASMFFFYNYMPIKKIKFSYMLGYSFIFLGSLIYILSVIYGSGHYKLRALILGGARFLIGLGSNPMLGKKYLTLYTPKYLLPTLSKIYLIIELCGFSLGPGITALLCFIHIYSGFCIFNCIGYYGVIGSIALILVNHFFFVSPKDPNFSTVMNQSNEDVNMSSSQTVLNNYDNDEDEEDKEFYKMQREKREKKKSGLEPTRSDDVTIVISDNQANKSVAGGMSNTVSAANYKEEKDDDDTNYNKIMENAGEGLGQNEVADNYYNNVDTGRYSDVDLSNEQRDTIKEIEKKLYEYQEKSNFTYINMMPRTIDDIILFEQKTFGYMNRNFIIMLVLLFFNNLIKENLIIFASYYLLFFIYNKGNIIKEADSSIKYAQNKKGVIQCICLILSASLLLQLLSIFFIMPFYKVNVIFKKNLIIFMLASAVLMIPLTFLQKYIGAYIPIISLDILLHKIIEVLCSCYLVYLIPPQWKYAHIRASSLPIYLMTFGKIFACITCFICYKMTSDAFNYNQILLICLAFTIYGILGVVILKSPNFRVKALSRILRKKAVE